MSMIAKCLLETAGGAADNLRPAAGLIFWDVQTAIRHLRFIKIRRSLPAGCLLTERYGMHKRALLGMPVIAMRDKSRTKWAFDVAIGEFFSDSKFGPTGQTMAYEVHDFTPHTRIPPVQRSTVPVEFSKHNDLFPLPLGGWKCFAGAVPQIVKPTCCSLRRKNPVGARNKLGL